MSLRQEFKTFLNWLTYPPATRPQSTGRTKYKLHWGRPHGRGPPRNARECRAPACSLWGNSHRRRKRGLGRPILTEESWHGLWHVTFAAGWEMSWKMKSSFHLAVSASDQEPLLRKLERWSAASLRWGEMPLCSHGALSSWQTVTNSGHAVSRGNRCRKKRSQCVLFAIPHKVLLNV